jgi:hypothetical protein
MLVLRIFLLPQPLQGALPGRKKIAAFVLPLTGFERIPLSLLKGGLRVKKKRKPGDGLTRNVMMRAHHPIPQLFQREERGGVGIL